MDEYLYDNSDFMIFVAGGNDGDNGYHTVGSPAVSKNVVSVGASEDGPNRTTEDISFVAGFSSLGPTMDGRIKPDVVTPGSEIISARAAGYSSQGTEATCNLEVMAILALRLIN